MTAPTVQNILTVRTFLFGSGGSEDDLTMLQRSLSEHGIVDSCRRELGELTQDGREAADEAVASVTGALLDVDLGDLLIYGWRMHQRLVNAAKETLRSPGRQEVVQLGSHQVTSTHNPTVELLVDGVRVHTFRFQVTVVFDIELAAAIVQNGQLVSLRAGDGSVTATVTAQMPGGDVELFRQRRRINLHLIVHLGRGIPLTARS
jgi:hypothetical protein